MCIIERKTYLHSDGRIETIETTRRCPRAVGSQFCRHVERRSVQDSRVVKTSPSNTLPSYSKEIAREWNDRAKVRPGRIPSRRRNTVGDSASASTSIPDRPWVYFKEEVKPCAPSPPPLLPGLPFVERRRDPYPPLSPPAPTRIFAPDGTATYGHPPSPKLPKSPVKTDVGILFEGQVAQDNARQHNGNVINSNSPQTYRNGSC